MLPLYLIVHHTASSRDKTTLQDVDNWHRARWPNFRSSLGFFVGYQYLILSNGRVLQTRRDNEEGAHTLGGYNQKAIGICLTGNFMVEEPSPEQLSALQPLLDKLKKDYNIADEKILGHREVWATDCPGKNLMKWLNLYRQLSFLRRQIQKLKQLLGLR
ncbi:MAG: peptidoglycan recognition family protein [Chloroflexota bacterium]